MKIYTKNEIVINYIQDNEGIDIEYLLSLIRSMNDEEFDEMVEKDYKLTLLRKGYYLDC